MKIALALLATILSACALNVGYLIEQSVASKLPRLTLHRPLQSARSLLTQRLWLLGFGIESVGWLLYVLALALAPLSLVQATAAGGIGILAVMVSSYRGIPLSSSEQVGVLVSIGGLALLGISLAGAHGEGSEPSPLAVTAWVGGSLVAALAILKFAPRVVPDGPSFGLATGVLFASGDIATKAVTEGELYFVTAVVAGYGFGTAVLQAGFQRGNALATAGVATLFTNALPIVAGMLLFAEPLPGGWLGSVRIAAFVLVIAGSLALARHQKGAAGAIADEVSVGHVEMRPA